MTYLYTPRTGPLAGQTVRVEAANTFHAEMLIDTATGQMPRAGELVEAGGFGGNFPTITEAVRLLNEHADRH